MTKQQEKAGRIVSRALSTFTKAVEEVEKANEILQKGIESDSEKMNTVTFTIENLKKEMETIQSEKLNKETEVIQNKELIAKLERFTK